MAAVDPSGELRAEVEGAGRPTTSMRSRRPAAGSAPASPRRRCRIRVCVGDRGGVREARHWRRRGGDPVNTDVAVRSSATVEDSADASFAGLQDTYLGVPDAPSVLEQVRRCWASLYNDESVAYRRRLRLPEAGVSMAVVVQRMVAPRAAGVMFTRSPVTGDRSVVAIEATWGLGSALVSGDVTPDSFIISKITGEITTRRVSEKNMIHSYLPNGPGVTVEDMPASAPRGALPDRRRDPRPRRDRPPRGGALRRSPGHRMGAPGRRHDQCGRRGRRGSGGSGGRAHRAAPVPSRRRCGPHASGPRGAPGPAPPTTCSPCSASRCD